MGTDKSLSIILLTGEKRAGKTTWLQTHKSESVGFLSPIINEKRNFQLIPSRIIFLMEESNGQLLVGKYTFSASAFAAVEQHVKSHYQADELIFDEIGPLEIRGEGFSSLVKHTLQNYSGKLLIVLRSEIVKEAIEAFQLDRFPVTVIDFEQLKNSGDTEVSY